MEPVAIEPQEVVKNLATIQVIDSLSPIEGADRIELARLKDMGWQVVVQKGIHKVGDFVVYIQIDTIVPEAKWSEFLRDKKFRVKTIRLKGQLSQGLIIPLNDFEVVPGILNQGQDVTENYGIKKFEKPIPANMKGKMRGNFPTKYLSMTDEERLQNCSRIIEELRDVPMFVTVKQDGSSATYINFENGDGTSDVHVCSRKISYIMDDDNKDNSFFRMERKYDIINKLKSKGSYAVQGEVCGPGIQGNKLGLADLDLFIFNVYDLKEHRYLNYDEFVAFCSELGFQTVPVIETNILLNDVKMDDLIKKADGQYPNGTLREGLVYRPMIERHSDYMKGRVSFKTVSNAFLEHYKE